LSAGYTALQSLPDRNLRGFHGRSAVAKTAPSAEVQRTSSEHDPGWEQATIEVETVEKGKITKKMVTVLFSPSTDVAWVDSPKLKEGDRAVWLLQKLNPDIWGNTVPRLALAVIKPLDRQPITELARIRVC